MMYSRIQNLAQQNISLYINTSTAGILSTFTNTPGVSKILVGGRLCYAIDQTRSIHDYKCVSQEAAIELANDAYLNAYQYGKNTPVGVGITAAFPTPNQREGRFNGAYIAVRYHDHVVTTMFTPGYKYTVGVITAERREEFDQEITEKALKLLLDQIEIWDVELVKKEIDKVESGWAQITYTDRRHMAPITKEWLSQFKFIYPVTGNPLHWGHIRGFKHAESLLGRGLFQFTLNHPIKGCANDQVKRLISDCMGFGELVIDENNGLYVDKAKEYGLPLVMGDDAMLKYLEMVGEDKLCGALGKVYVLKRVLGNAYVDIVTNAGGVPLMNQAWHISSSQLRD